MGKGKTIPKAETKVPVRVETSPAPMAMQAWRPFEGLRREMDRLFEDFTCNPFRLPLRRPVFTSNRSGIRILDDGAGGGFC